MKDKLNNKGRLGLAIIAEEVYDGHQNYSFYDDFNFMEYSSLLFDLDSILYSSERTYGTTNTVTSEYADHLRNIAAKKIDALQVFLAAGRTVFVVISPVPSAASEGTYSRRLNIFQSYPWEKMRVKLSRGQTSGDIADQRHPSLVNLLGLTNYTYTLSDIEGEALAYATGTKDPICLAQNAHNGRVIYVPKPRVGSRGTPNQDLRNAYGVFLNCVADELATEVAAEPLPGWSYDFSTNALLAIEAARDQIQENLKELSLRFEETDAIAKEEGAFRQLLAGTGVELENVAKKALTSLGFDLLNSPRGSADALAKLGQEYFAFEIKGLTKSAQLKNCRQTTQWVQDAEAIVNSNNEDGEITVKGVLVVVPFRETPLDQRTEEPFPVNVVEYAQKRNLCLISGEQLLFAWLQAEANSTRATEFATAIRETAGVLKFTTAPEQVLLRKKV